MFSDTYYELSGPSNEILMTIKKKSPSPRNWSYVFENNDSLKLQGEFPKFKFTSAGNQVIVSAERTEPNAPWDGFLIFVNPAVNVPLFWCTMMIILEKYKNRVVE
jgi:uncharacterized protein YxjI